MSRTRKIGALVGGVAVAAIAAVTIGLGVIGVEQTVTSGTQPTVCGVTVGVNSSGQTVRLLGVSDEALSPGDRVRVSPLCVVEIVSIDDSDLDADADGGARVHLRWRLW